MWYKQEEYLFFVLVLGVPCCSSHTVALPTDYDISSFPQSPWAGDVANAPMKELGNLYHKLFFWSLAGNNRSQCQTSLSRLASDLLNGKSYAKRGMLAVLSTSSALLFNLQQAISFRFWYDASLFHRQVHTKTTTTLPIHPTLSTMLGRDQRSTDIDFSGPPRLADIDNLAASIGR